MEKKASQSVKNALQLSVLYLVFGMLWIYFSDQWVGLFSVQTDQILLWQTYKGFFFVGVTAVLLYLLSYRILEDRYGEYTAHIDQQHIVQQQLMQQDALLHSLINSSPDAIVIKGLDRRYVVFNKGASTLSGVEENYAIGKTADEIFPQETADIINRIDNDLIEKNNFVEHEETMLMPNGITKIYWVTKGLLKMQDNAIFGIFGIYRDITAMKRNEQLILDEKERYDYMAHHDPLTGLPNRLSLIENLHFKSTQASDAHFALMFLDLDGFKEINDSFGHRFGDQILIQFSKLLEEIFPKMTLIIRTGGDEFVILLESKFDHHTIQMYLNSLIQMLNAPFIIDQIEVYITVSIGISLYPDDTLNYEELLQKADAAMYKAKSLGRNTYSFYNDGLTQEVLEKTTLASNLKKALSNRELILFYQPQICPASGRIIGAEALIRWPTDEGMIPPSIFVPIAEERSIIVELGEFVLEEGFKAAALWASEGILSGRIAINVSAKQLMHQNFLFQVEELIHKTLCSPEWIELEITESSILEHPEKMIALLSILKSKGFRISIDDFGTGYSSLSYLKHLPVDKLKIDISFIRNITMEPKNQTIVKTIIALAKGLGMTSVAEVVESADELEYLRLSNVDSIQGYYYYKPMEQDAIESLFIQQNTGMGQ